MVGMTRDSEKRQLKKWLRKRYFKRYLGHKDYICQLCGEIVTTGEIVQHFWTKHRSRYLTERSDMEMFIPDTSRIR